MKCKECGSIGAHHFSSCSVGQELYEDENDNYQEDIRENQVKIKKDNINKRYRD